MYLIIFAYVDKKASIWSFKQKETETNASKFNGESNYIIFATFILNFIKQINRAARPGIQ